MGMVLWCKSCKRSFDLEDAPEGRCPICDGTTREMGRMRAAVRGILAQEMTASDIQTKHRQLIKLIWTQNRMGERYFQAIQPSVSYSQFERQVTELICRGAEEGWIRVIIPPAPTSDDNYRLEFVSEERFVEELDKLYPDD
ncbi:hypothetical protein [Nitrolancea hollandica]|uniref:Uncharacterized protein n=1 Tax=Nitrolancea hollandica Lb TaxID=1129897 RepID=I4EIZ3_9BACT|nr:hypothetical protein [Nitrolancea hollandica]CCF84655.1 hypothetical protein NITHO_370028 [Nitrolancea hollandica Lb]